MNSIGKNLGRGIGLYRISLKNMIKLFYLDKGGRCDINPAGMI